MQWLKWRGGARELNPPTLGFSPPPYYNPDMGLQSTMRYFNIKIWLTVATILLTLLNDKSFEFYGCIPFYKQKSKLVSLNGPLLLITYTVPYIHILNVLHVPMHASVMSNIYRTTVNFSNIWYVTVFS